MRILLLLPFTLIPLHAADFRASDYGAKGDGTTVDTAAIQKAIDAAAKSNGTVVFKPGVYLTGSLFLKSGSNLRLDEGVEIRGVQDLAPRYPIMPTRVAGIEMNWPAALINVYEQSHVTISRQRHSRWRRQVLVGPSTGICGAKSTSRRACAGPPTTIAERPAPDPDLQFVERELWKGSPSSVPVSGPCISATRTR